MTNENNNEKLNDEELLQVEDSVLKGILGAANDIKDNVVEIVISRDGVEYFRFNIRGLSEKEYSDLHDQATTFRKARNLGGVRVAEKTDNTRFRSLLIYHATVKEDRERIWDNKEAWSGLNVINAHDMIDKVLKAGEKGHIIDKIDEISGFNDDEDEDLVKNS